MAVLCFAAGAGCYWRVSHLSEGAVCPDGRYELKTHVSLLGSQIPIMVDSRTGDMWMFVPLGDSPESGWQHFDPPRRPGPP